MNEANYASFEASKRLVDAGIVLETEAHWWQAHKQIDWILQYKNIGLGDMLKLSVNCIPAPSMAEVWRELPETALQPCRDTTTGYCHEYLSLQKDGDLTVAGYGEYSEIGRNTNPTDALIDLLIWQRKEAENMRLQLMNPCKHTGFEAAPCDICGYPDPRKALAGLRTSRDEWRRIAEEANKRIKELLDEA